MQVYYGVVKDRRVVLDDDVRLDDGTRVEVRPRHAQTSNADAEEIVKERLRAAGILAPLSPSGNDDEDDDFEPIMVEGEPLSQMLLRERR